MADSSGLGSISGAVGGMAGGMGGIGAGIGGLIGGLFGTPSPPSAIDLTNKAFSQYYFGLNQHQYNKYRKLQQIQQSGKPFSKSEQQQWDKLSNMSQNKAILPQEFQQEANWLPQFTQLALSNLGTQATGLAGLQQSLTNQINPQYQQIQANLGNQVNSQIGQGLSPQETQYFTQQLAQQQAAQGLYGSPLSSQNIALQLTPLDMAQRQQNIGNAMQYGSAYPNVANSILGLGVNTSPTGQSLGGAGTTPTSMSDYQNLVNSLAGINYQNSTNRSNQLAGSVGQIGSGLFSAATGALGAFK